MTTVTCAIIEQNGKILCAQRGATMDLPMKWEFPGGKQEDGESLELCLQREIQEELGLEISIIEKLPEVQHTYPNKKPIQLIPFHCMLIGGYLTIKEHNQIKWLFPKELRNLNWAEADIPIVNYYILNYDGN